MRRLVRFSLLLSAFGLTGLGLFVASSPFQRMLDRMLDLVDRALTEPEVIERVVYVQAPAPQAAPSTVSVSNNVDNSVDISNSVNISNGFGRSATLGGLAAAVEGLWSESTCTVGTSPAGATVWRRDLFGEPEYLGVTPITIDRPLSSERVYLQVPGYQTGEAWLIPRKVHQPCVSELVLRPA